MKKIIIMLAAFVMIAANGFGQTPGGAESSVVLLYIICAIVGWVVFYYVIKAAVKNGIIEARNHSDNTTDTIAPSLFIPSSNSNTAPNPLQNKIRTLSPLKGKAYDDLIKIIGKPTTAVGKDGGIYCSWNYNAYVVNLYFSQEGICKGLDGE